MSYPFVEPVTEPARGERVAFTPVGMVLLWAAVGVVLHAGGYWLTQALWLGAGLLDLLHFVWGVGLLVWLVWFARRQSIRSAVATLALTVAFFFAGPLLTFAAVSPFLDRVVADVAAGRVTGSPERRELTAHGVTFRPGRERRDLVAFVVVSGIPDGVIAYVYDGTDAAGRLSGDDWSMADDVAALISGKPESCEPLFKPHYFSCYFS